MNIATTITTTAAASNFKSHFWYGREQQKTESNMYLFYLNVTNCLLMCVASTSGAQVSFGFGLWSFCCGIVGDQENVH